MKELLVLTSLPIFSFKFREFLTDRPFEVSRLTRLAVVFLVRGIVIGFTIACKLYNESLSRSNATLEETQPNSSKSKISVHHL